METRAQRSDKSDLDAEWRSIVDGLELAAIYRAGGDEVERVGGDWYDALPLADGRVALVVGDVMGRGVHASAVMTRTRAAVRAFISVDPTPATVLSNLDRYLIQEDTEEFVTCVYVLVDPRARTARYVNAGHPPVLVIKADGQAHWPSTGDGDLPVGLMTHPRVERSLDLEAGATVVLFTDGLVERRNRDLDEGLLSLESAARTAPWQGDLTDVLASIVQDSLEGSIDDDDVTVLAARVH